MILVVVWRWWTVGSGSGVAVWWYGSGGGCGGCDAAVVVCESGKQLWGIGQLKMGKEWNKYALTEKKKGTDIHLNW